MDPKNRLPYLDIAVSCRRNDLSCKGSCYSLNERAIRKTEAVPDRIGQGGYPCKDARLTGHRKPFI